MNTHDIERLLDRIEREGSTPLDWPEYNDARAAIEQDRQSRGEPVATKSAQPDPAMAGDEGMPPIDDRAAYSAEHVRTLIRIDRSRQRVQPASGEARE